MWLPGRVHPCHFNPRSPHGERRQPSMLNASLIYFNPRSPHGERHRALFVQKGGAVHFNPRSPHGERPRQSRQSRQQPAISIHAPRTGSDASGQQPAERASRQQFQSTLPARGATLLLSHTHSKVTFQSTLPARGATVAVWTIEPQDEHFNPRSPHGERQIILGDERSSTIFQSTLPARGATSRAGHSPRRRDFNPRSPHGERPLGLAFVAV